MNEVKLYNTIQYNAHTFCVVYVFEKGQGAGQHALGVI